MSVRINSLSKARRLNFRNSVCSPAGEQLSFGVVSIASAKLFKREERKESQPALCRHRPRDAEAGRDSFLSSRMKSLEEAMDTTPKDSCSPAGEQTECSKIEAARF